MTTASRSAPARTQPGDRPSPWSTSGPPVGVQVVARSDDDAAPTALDDGD